MKESKGFTLLELLVVVAVIGLLVAITMPVVGGAIKRARSAACVSNLKQLHTAVMTMCQDGHNIPDSSSCLYESQVKDEGGGTIIDESGLRTGWVDWHNDDPTAGDIDHRTYWWGTNGLQSVRNGSLWEYMGEVGVYCCPEFRKVVRKNQGASKKVSRSYGLNEVIAGRAYNSLEAPHRQLLFADQGYTRLAEVNENWEDPGLGGSAVGSRRVRYFRSWDGALDWHRGGRPDPYEPIGDYHGKDGRGNCIFADGHTESVKPEDTELICTGDWGL